MHEDRYEIYRKEKQDKFRNYHYLISFVIDNNSNGALNSSPIRSTTITTTESNTVSITESTDNDISTNNESNRTNDQEQTMGELD